MQRTGDRKGLSLLIGSAAGRLRDFIAAGLIAAGVTPNTLTISGCVVSGLAAACLVLGAGHVLPWEAKHAPGPASWWPLWSAILLTVAFAQDMLDGAVARLGGLSTPFGAILDSSLDRLSDLPLFGGCAVHFAWCRNVTFVALSLAAATHALLISYVKARTECIVDNCSVGYWQRGERCGLVWVAAWTGHLPAALWVLATLPSLTVLRRLRQARAATSGLAPPAFSGRLYALAPWRHPRGSIGYDLCMGLALAFTVAGPCIWPALYGQADPLGNWLDAWSGG